jgi:hypothetical protein
MSLSVTPASVSRGENNVFAILCAIMIYAKGGEPQAEERDRGSSAAGLESYMRVYSIVRVCSI